MNQISFDDSINLPPKIPVSIQGIVMLPSFLFNPDTFIIVNEWKEAINEWILLTYTGMVVSGKVRIYYTNEKINRLEEFVGLNSRCFIPSIQNVDFDWEIGTYLEKRIFTTIEVMSRKGQIDTKGFFKQHIEHLIDLLLGKKYDYTNPWKVIAERLIKEDNLGFWTFKENKKFFGQFKKIEVCIEEDNKKMLMKELNRTEHMVEILNKDELFNSFSSFLRIKINRAIRKRQASDD